MTLGLPWSCNRYWLKSLRALQTFPKASSSRIHFRCLPLSVQGHAEYICADNSQLSPFVSSLMPLVSPSRSNIVFLWIKPFLKIIYTSLTRANVQYTLIQNNKSLLSRVFVESPRSSYTLRKKATKRVLWLSLFENALKNRFWFHVGLGLVTIWQRNKWTNGLIWCPFQYLSSKYLSLPW